jgi:hypothetical protein
MSSRIADLLLGSKIFGGFLEKGILTPVFIISLSQGIAVIFVQKL